MNEQGRRILMTVAGVTIGAVGAGMMTYLNLGVDPFQVFTRGLWGRTPLDFGTFYVILNALMLAVILVWNRHMIGLGTLINLFGVGYILEWTRAWMAVLFPDPSPLLRGGLMAASLVILCFASALYFTADMGVSTYDAVALTLAARQKRVPFKYIRILTDLFCVITGWLLGARWGYVGIGTIITAFFMGPLIAFFNRTVAQPLRAGRAGTAARRVQTAP